MNKVLKGLLGCMTAGLIAGCNTPMPCDPGPGGLCAPIASNTSAPERGRRAEPLPPAEVTQVPASPPAGSVETRPIDLPGAKPVAPILPADTGRTGAIRIALMLPLRSESLGRPAEAVRAGFMAAHERDREGFVISLVTAGETPEQAAADYAAAVENNDIVVGPLARSAVTALATGDLVRKPTIALNHPDGRAGRPALMLVMGLSIEDEARQVAQLAAAEHPGARAMIVSGVNHWQRRIAQAFAAQWKQLKLQSEVVELRDSNGYLSESELAQLKLRVDAAPPTLLFAALDADQAGQMRTNLDSELPVYGASSVNPGLDPGAAMSQLDGLRLLDLPWEVLPDHAAVKSYPARVPNRRTLDMDRLYALGIDAFRVAREIALRPNTPFKIDGVTGRLSGSVGTGPSRFSRIYPAVVYQNGAFTPVQAGR